jgi:hypothetical protein
MELSAGIMRPLARMILLRQFLLRYYLAAAAVVLLLKGGLDLLIESLRPLVNSAAVKLYLRAVRPATEVEPLFTLSPSLQYVYGFFALITCALGLLLSLWVFEDGETPQ